jgi:hypothetical protein
MTKTTWPYSSKLDLKFITSSQFSPVLNFSYSVRWPHDAANILGFAKSNLRYVTAS